MKTPDGTRFIAGIQMLAGWAAIVLGILSVAGYNPTILTPVALLLLGVTAIVTGSALSRLVFGFMRPVRTYERT